MRPIYKSLFQVAGFVWMLAPQRAVRGPSGVSRRTDIPGTEQHYGLSITQLKAGRGWGKKEKELLFLGVISAAAWRREESLIDDFIRFN